MSNPKEQDNPAATKIKKEAGRLHSILKPRIPEIKHGECLDYMARLNGARNWKELTARIDREEADHSAHIKEMDDFVDEVMVGYIKKVAPRYNMEVSASPSVEGSIFIQDATDRNITRGTTLIITPKGSDICEFRCPAQISGTLVELDFGEFNFECPKSALPTLNTIITSDVVTDDMTPQITRNWHGRQKEAYDLTLHISILFAEVLDTKVKPSEDAPLIAEFHKRADKIIARISTLLHAFCQLSGNWSDKNAARKFENAIWKAFMGSPRYMAESSDFHEATIGGVELTAFITSNGPYIGHRVQGLDKSVALDNFNYSIVHHERTKPSSAEMIREHRERKGEKPDTLYLYAHQFDNNPSGYYIAKYHNQLALPLGDISDADAMAIAQEFGMTITLKGTLADKEFKFAESPAFEGLQAWARKHPKQAATYKTAERYNLGNSQTA